MWNKRTKGQARQTGHKATMVDGHKFHSKGESEMYLILRKWLEDGKIIALDKQKTIKLTNANIGFRVDFVITNPDGSQEGVEFKGWPNEIFLLKKKLYKHYGPFKLSIYKKSGKNIYLDEVIIPVVNNETT